MLSRYGHNGARRTLRSAMVQRAFALTAAVLGSMAFAGVASAAAPGSLDPTFGSGGVATLASGFQGFGVAVESDGDVLVAGQSGGHVLLQRLSSAGKVVGTYTGAAGYARAVAVAPNGDIVLAGSSGGAMFVERLTSGLAPDGSFGSGGVVSAFGGQTAIAYGVSVAADGSVVAAGSIGSGDSEAAAVRLSASGAVQWADPLSFGARSLIRAVATQSNGSIVLVGSQTPGQVTNAVIARLTPTGALDTSFAGGRGALTYSYPGSGYTAMNAVAIQSNGEIVAAGSAAEGPTEVTLGITSAGALDASFGSGGAAALPAGQNVNVMSYAIGAYGVTIAAGGRIVAAGSYENTGVDVDQGLWSFSSRGAPDTTFGSAGIVRAPQGAFEGCAVAVAPDGSLVTAGNSVPMFPDMNPCGVNASASGFVARFAGYGAVGGAPSATTGRATAITANGAKLSGQINPNGMATTYQFQYGKTTKYGSSTKRTSAGAGTSAVNKSVSLRKLKKGVTYHYRLVATNSRGTTDGADRRFKTGNSSVRVTLKGLGSSYKKSSVAKSGLRFRVGCSKGCSIKASLIASAAIARHLHVLTTTRRCTTVKGKKRCVKTRKYLAFTVASASAKLKSAGTKTLTIRGGRLSAALRSSRTVSLTLSVVATARGGKTMVKRTIKFHP